MAQKQDYYKITLKIEDTSQDFLYGGPTVISDDNISMEGDGLTDNQHQPTRPNEVCIRNPF